MPTSSHSPSSVLGEDGSARISRCGLCLVRGGKAAVEESGEAAARALSHPREQVGGGDPIGSPADRSPRGGLVAGIPGVAERDDRPGRAPPRERRAAVAAAPDHDDRRIDTRCAAGQPQRRKLGGFAELKELEIHLDRRVGGNAMSDIPLDRFEEPVSQLELAGTGVPGADHPVVSQKDARDLAEYSDVVPSGIVGRRAGVAGSLTRIDHDRHRRPHAEGHQRDQPQHPGRRPGDLHGGTSDLERVRAQNTPMPR